MPWCHRAWPQLWLAETLSSADEARRARCALGNDARPLWLSFTLDDDALSERPTLRSGETIDAATETAVDLGCCGIGPMHIAAVRQDLREAGQTIPER